jgi:hypothetical protein
MLISSVSPHPQHNVCVHICSNADYRRRGSLKWNQPTWNCDQKLKEKTSPKYLPSKKDRADGMCRWAALLGERFWVQEVKHKVGSRAGAEGASQGEGYRTPTPWAHSALLLS